MDLFLYDMDLRHERVKISLEHVSFFVIFSKIFRISYLQTEYHVEKVAQVSVFRLCCLD